MTEIMNDFPTTNGSSGMAANNAILRKAKRNIGIERLYRTFLLTFQAQHVIFIRCVTGTYLLLHKPASVLPVTK